MPDRPSDKPNGADPASSLDPAVWVDEHGDYLFRYALFRMRDRQRAEDAVQETLLAAIRAKGSFSGKSSVRTWLVGILKHKVIDHFRKTSRESSLDAVEDPDALIEKSFNRREHWARGGPAPSSWGRKPDQAMESGDFWQVFSDCLKGLPEKQAAAFSMREFDGSSSEEISKVLEITTTNLWVMLHRARARLRDCLETNWFRAS